MVMFPWTNGVDPDRLTRAALSGSALFCKGRLCGVGVKRCTLTWMLFKFTLMLFICHVRGVCSDASSSNKICFNLFGGFFTPNTKMMELMEQDAQLLKTFFYFTSLICICDALIQVGHNGSLHLFL